MMMQMSYNFKDYYTPSNYHNINEHTHLFTTFNARFRLYSKL